MLCKQGRQLKEERRAAENVERERIFAKRKRELLRRKRSVNDRTTPLPRSKRIEYSY